MLLQFNMSKKGEETPADGKMDELLDSVSLNYLIPNEVENFMTIIENMPTFATIHSFAFFQIITIIHSFHIYFYIYFYFECAHNCAEDSFSVTMQVVHNIIL